MNCGHGRLYISWLIRLPASILCHTLVLPLLQRWKMLNQGFTHIRYVCVRVLAT